MPKETIEIPLWLYNLYFNLSRDWSNLYIYFSS